jgi:hypothetical protein
MSAKVILLVMMSLLPAFSLSQENEKKKSQASNNPSKTPDTKQKQVPPSSERNNRNTDAPIERQRILQSVSDLLFLSEEITNDIEEDATIRITLQLKIADSLWTHKQNAEAEIVAKSTLENLKKSHEAIPGYHSNRFKAQLLALLKSHPSDNTAKLLNDEYFITKDDGRSSFRLSSDLVKQKKPDDALKSLQQGISEAREFDLTWIFYSSYLLKSHPEQLESIFSHILNVLEQNSSDVTVNALAHLESLANSSLRIDGNKIKTEISSALKRKWLGFLVQRIAVIHQTFAWGPANRPDIARVLIATELPNIKQLIPDLFLQASFLQTALYGLLSPDVQQRIDFGQHLEQSDDKAGELFSEAIKSKSKDERDRLLIQAGLAALEQDNLPKAIEAAESLESEEKPSQSNAIWIDNLYSRIVEKSLERKDYDLAEKVSDKIKNDKTRINTMQKVALSLYRSGAVLRAKDNLRRVNKELNLIKSAGGKALGFLDLVKAYLVVDKMEVRQTAQLAFKAIDSMPTYNDSKKFTPSTKSETPTEVSEMLWVIESLVPLFSELTQHSDFDCYSLAQQIEQKSARRAALIGVYSRRLSR